MEDLKSQIESLLNDTPIERAIHSQSSSHFAELGKDDANDARQSGELTTDENNHTLRVRKAAINMIKHEVDDWIKRHNDIKKQAQTKMDNLRSPESDDQKRQQKNEVTIERQKLKDNYNRDNNYNDLKYNFDVTKERYERMRAEGDGKPPVGSRAWLYVIAISLIGFIEWFVNYSTFSTKYPPGIAFGATVLVALSIALASHFHGGLLKQRLALFADHIRTTEKRQVILKQGFFSLLLIISLFIVTYNRYDILVANTIQAGGVSLAGMDEDMQSITGILVQFALLNVLVWIVGVAISYFIHDARPDYQEAFLDYEKAKSKFNKVDNGLKKEERRLDLDLRDKNEREQNKKRSQKADHEALNAQVERLNVRKEDIFKGALTAMNERLEEHKKSLIAELSLEYSSDLKIGPERLLVEQFKLNPVCVDAEFVRTQLLEAI